jgi:hypothetical protein
LPTSGCRGCNQLRDAGWCQECLPRRFPRPGPSPKVRRLLCRFGSRPGASSGHAAEQRPPSNIESAGLMGSRFNVSSTMPVHGAGPWVIVETPHPTPPQTTRVTHPASSFAWMVRASKDSSTVAGAHLRWLGSHARGDPQKQRRHHARGLDAGFTETRVFFVRLHVYFEEEPGRLCAV